MDLETLERRRLYTVSVVQGYPGYYEVRGTDASEAISIAVSSADSSFTLDGVTYPGAAYVSVYAGGGDDTVTVSADGPTQVGASVDAGPGDDSVTLNLSGAVWGGPGADTIRLNDSYRGEAYGEQDDDKIYLSGQCVDAVVDGGQGSDLIDATGSAYGVFAHGGQGADTIFGSNFDDQIYGDAGADLLIGNAGNDSFYAADLEHDRIIGGAGIDVAYADLGDSTWGVEYVFYV